jgi:hypothetical protein
MAVTRQGLASQLRISRRTVINSVNTLKNMGLWDGNKVAVDDFLHYWQDTKPKRGQDNGQRPLRLARYIMKDFPASYAMQLYPEKDDMRAALGRHEERLIAAGYKATDILEVWDHAWQALNCKCPRMECYAFHFWKILETVEKETQRNRRSGVFDGPNSKGLLKARTNAVGRRLEDRLRRDGLGSLLGWEPSFEKMNGEVTAVAGT